MQRRHQSSSATTARLQRSSPHTPPPFGTTSRGYSPSVQTPVQLGVQNPLHNPPCKVLGAKDPPPQFTKRAKPPPAALHRATPSVQNRLQPLMQPSMQHPARNPSGARARASAHLQAPRAISPANPSPQPPCATVHATPQLQHRASALQKHSCNPPKHPRARCSRPRSPPFATSHACNAPPWANKPATPPTHTCNASGRAKSHVHEAACSAAPR